MPINMPAGWRESASVTKTTVALARIYYGPEGSTDYIPVGTGEVTIDGDHYAPLMQSVPPVDYGVDIYTHKSETGDLRLRLVNQGLSDLFESTGFGNGSDIGIENRSCEVRLWTMGITAWSDCLLYFKGLIRRIAHDEDIIWMNIQSQDQLAYRDLPRTDINQTDYPNAPPSSIGKYLPICIGSIDYAPGVITDNTVDVWTSSYPIVNFDDSAYGPNGFKAYNTIASSPYPQGPLFTWTGSRFVPARTDSSKRYNSGSSQLADCRMDFNAASINVIAEIYPSTGSSNWDGSNSARVTDGDISLASEKSNNAPWTRTVTLRTDEQGNLSAQKNWDVYAFCRIEATTQADSTATVKLFDQDGNSVTVMNLSTSTTITFNNMSDPPPDSYTAKLLGSYALNGDQSYYYELDAVKTGSGNFNVYMAVFELGLVAVTYENDHSKWGWYANVDGRKDDGSGTYTGTANALIELPTDAIWQIAANDLGITNIDTSAFSDSRAVLSGWKHAYSITGQVNSRDLFSSLGRQSKSYAYFGVKGNFKVATLADSYASADRVLDFRAVIAPKFARTKLSRIATRVIVKYNRNYATGVLENRITGSDSAQQIRYKLTESQSTLEVDADAIRDATSAGKLRDFLLRQWKQPHNLFEGELPLDHIDLDVGDIIELTHVPMKIHGEDVTINNTRSGQTIYKYWWIYGVRRSNSNIRIKAMQLHDLS